MGIEALRQLSSALSYWELKHQVVANNLANVSTPGFKGDRVFARVMEDMRIVAQSSKDFRAGTYTKTDRPLDIALEGDAFFVVESPDGERLVRGGSFELDSSGRVVDTDGFPLMGQGGDLVLPPGTIGIDNEGRLSVDGVEFGQLRVVTVKDPEQMERAGGVRWIAPPGEVTPTPQEDVRIRQGTLEESNVASVESLIGLLSIQRGYAAVQRAIQTLDSVMQTATTQIGGPAG